MSDLAFRPIDRWPNLPDPTSVSDVCRRSPWSFKAGYDDTLNLLQHEAEKLDARGPVVVQLALVEDDLRRDGMLRAHAQPTHPGVIVSFESRHGPLQYATDEFALWQHNLRAIALGLEALRKVDRYGISKGGEQYAGWKQLPAATGDTMDREAARAFIDRYGGSYREAAKRLHPDTGGSAEDFKLLQRAHEALGE